MFPFVKLTDNTITLRPFEFGEENALRTAVHESLPELEPWMSWANEKYSNEVARIGQVAQCMPLQLPMRKQGNSSVVAA